MNCQNCHELLEPGAAFCGNCGYPVQPPNPVAASPNQAVPAPVVQNPQPTQPVVPVNQSPATAALPPPAPTSTATPTATVPSYARATPSQHIGETPALLAVIFGVIGIIGTGFFIPAIGFGFGVAGLCAGTVSRRRAQRRLAIVGLVFAALAIVAGFAALVYNTEHDKNSTPNSQTGQSSTSSRVLSKLNTPCYSFNLIDQYNVSNTAGSCDATAFNGQSFTNSTDIYKIVATKAGTSDPGTFTQLAKQAVESDVKNNLPGFTITSQGPSSFAGSPAYTVYAIDKSQGSAVVESGVLHQTRNGDNAFVVFHAQTDTSVTLQALEAQWRWK